MLVGAASQLLNGVEQSSGGNGYAGAERPVDLAESSWYRTTPAAAMNSQAATAIDGQRSVDCHDVIGSAGGSAGSLASTRSLTRDDVARAVVGAGVTWLQRAARTLSPAPRSAIR